MNIWLFGTLLFFSLPAQAQLHCTPVLMHSGLLCLLQLDWALSLAGCLQVLKFSGCYHGHADSFLVQAGSGVATLGLPDSPGVPAASTGTYTLHICLLTWRAEGYYGRPE